jgi:hypothetical protein
VDVHMDGEGGVGGGDGVSVTSVVAGGDGRVRGDERKRGRWGATQWIGLMIWLILWC